MRRERSKLKHELRAIQVRVNLGVRNEALGVSERSKGSKIPRTSSKSPQGDQRERKITGLVFSPLLEDCEPYVHALKVQKRTLISIYFFTGTFAIKLLWLNSRWPKYLLTSLKAHSTRIWTPPINLLKETWLADILPLRNPILNFCNLDEIRSRPGLVTLIYGHAECRNWSRSKFQIVLH